jgi:hypothetical protein
MIKKVKGKYVIYSHKGRRLGKFKSLSKARNRLRQIEYFKNKRK